MSYPIILGVLLTLVYILVGSLGVHIYRLEQEKKRDPLKRLSVLLLWPIALCWFLYKYIEESIIG